MNRTTLVYEDRHGATRRELLYNVDSFSVVPGSRRGRYAVIAKRTNNQNITIEGVEDVIKPTRVRQQL